MMLLTVLPPLAISGLHASSSAPTAAGQVKPRQAPPLSPDELYVKAVTKGRSILCKLKPDSVPASSSPSNDFGALASYGWSLRDDDPVSEFPEDIDDCLAAYGIAKGRPANVYVEQQHLGRFRNRNGQEGVCPCVL